MLLINNIKFQLSSINILNFMKNSFPTKRILHEMRYTNGWQLRLLIIYFVNSIFSGSRIRSISFLSISFLLLIAFQGGHWGYMTQHPDSQLFRLSYHAHQNKIFDLTLLTNSRLASWPIFSKYFHVKYHRKTLQNILI